MVSGRASPVRSVLSYSCASASDEGEGEGGGEEGPVVLKKGKGRKSSATFPLSFASRAEGRKKEGGSD